MNPNAIPFLPLKRTYTAAFEPYFVNPLDLAIAAPLAPISDLTDADKGQQQVEPLGKQISYQELLAMSISMSAAEFVLQ